MKSLILARLLAFFCLIVPLQLMAQNFYLTSGDSDITYIIDLSNGSFSQFSTATQTSAYALGVTDRILLSDRSNSSVVEYTLAGVPTGNTWTGSGNFDQLLDGTTDGQGNYYGASFSSNGVTVSDNTFTNTSVLFNPGFVVIGITYDSSDGTLWLVNDSDHNIYNYSLSGVQLSSFSPGLSGRECCLAYDEANDTLWLSTNGSNVISQFSKTGSLISSVTVAGLSPGNSFGGEMAIGGNSMPPGFGPATGIPVMGLWTGMLLILLISLLALIGRKRV